MKNFLPEDLEIRKMLSDQGSALYLLGIGGVYSTPPASLAGGMKVAPFLQFL